MVPRNADESGLLYNMTWMPFFLALAFLDKDIYLAST